MAPEHTLRIRNGPRSDPVKLFMRVNGRIRHPRARNGRITLHVKNETARVPFRGTVTKFDFEGQGTVTIEGEQYRADDVVGYDTRTRPSDGGDGGDSDGPLNPPERPETPGGPVHGGGGNLKPDAGDAVGQRDLRPSHGIVNRPYQSKSDRTITVGRGGDVPTLQAAMNRLPLRVEHKIKIRLLPGVHNSEPADSVNAPPTLISAAYASVKIVGDPETPGNVVLDLKQANFNFYSGTAQDSALEGIHIKGTVQNRVGYTEVDRCIVESGRVRHGQGDPVPLDMYGGHYQVLGSRIEGPGAAVNLVENGSVSFNQSSKLVAGGPLLTTGQGGGIVDFSGNADVRAEDGLTDGWEPGTAVIRDTHGATKGVRPGRHAIRLK